MEIVIFQAASISNYENKNGERYVVLSRGEEVYLGKQKNYDRGRYDNSDDSLIFVSENGKMFSFLSGSGWTVSQQKLIDNGAFTPEDYAEFAALRVGLLSQFLEVREVKFEIDIDKPGSGIPFQFPDWK